MCIIIRVNGSLLANFARGLCRRVFGETPTSPVVSFVLLRELWESCMADLANLLNAARSAVAFSSDTTLVMHLEQTCDERWSSCFKGMSKRVEILKAHPRSRDFLVNRLVMFLSPAFPEHSRHNTLEAIAINHLLSPHHMACGYTQYSVYARANAIKCMT